MRKLPVVVSLFLFVSAYSYTQSSDQIISFLHDIDYDRSRARFGSEIIFIEEFNFGIPGGSNWLAVWSHRGNRVPIIYAIDYANREIIFRHQIGLMTQNDPSHVNSWYQSLPGISIDTGRGMLQVGDFNGTGYVQIITFFSAVAGSHFLVARYEPTTNRIRWTRIYIVNYTKPDEPPVVFIRYRSMDGFKLNYHQPPEVAGGPTWISSPPCLKNNRWFFYTWDEEESDFVIVEEVNPEYVEEIDRSRFIPRLPPRVEQASLSEDVVMAVQSEAVPALAINPTETTSRFNPQMTLVFGIILLVVVTSFVGIKKKNRV